MINNTITEVVRKVIAPRVDVSFHSDAYGRHYVTAIFESSAWGGRLEYQVELEHKDMVMFEEDARVTIRTIIEKMQKLTPEVIDRGEK